MVPVLCKTRDDNKETENFPLPALENRFNYQDLKD